MQNLSDGLPITAIILYNPALNLATESTTMSDFRQEFLTFALKQNVLKFGEFTTKAGRQSPYFFNAGLFNDGASTLQLAKFYAQAIIESGIKFDMLFGPALRDRKSVV